MVHAPGSFQVEILTALFSFMIQHLRGRKDPHVETKTVRVSLDQRFLSSVLTEACCVGASWPSSSSRTLVEAPQRGSHEYLTISRDEPACLQCVMYMLCFCAQQINVQASLCERFVAALA